MNCLEWLNPRWPIYIQYIVIHLYYLYVVILHSYVGVPLPLPGTALRLKGISARHEECAVLSGEPFLDLLEKSFQAAEWSCCLDGEYPKKMGSPSWWNSWAASAFGHFIHFLFFGKACLAREWAWSRSGQTLARPWQKKRSLEWLSIDDF